MRQRLRVVHRLPSSVAARLAVAIFSIGLASGATFVPVGATTSSVTVLYDDLVIDVEHTLTDPNDLWVMPAELPHINGFELKPEGACLAELCVPVLQDRDSEMFVTRGGQGWFNVTELARRLQQAYIADHDQRVWSFGEIPVKRTRFFDSAMAPDFALPNRKGQLVRLSGFRGKKVLLVTWASW